jgi:hypothetical protein
VAQSEVRRDHALSASLASPPVPPAPEVSVRPGLSAARGVLVALVLGSAVWLAIAIVVLALSGRL